MQKDEINPDFDRVNIIVQPETKRCRAAYLSPISSFDLNQFYNTCANDIANLYLKVENLKTKANSKLKKISDTNIGEINSETIESIYYYMSELELIKSQISKLR